MNKRTHNCGTLSIQDVGKEVCLSGWVHRRRDHGGVIFLDLRDRYGLTQLVIHPETDVSLHEEVSHVRSEWVINITGKVRTRLPGMSNPKLATGEIEVDVYACEFLAKAEVSPFSICDEHVNVNEELRLQYRYLDIRRGDIASRLIFRHQAALFVRNFLDKEGFLEIVTPLLGKATPEGARDYLIPSRIYPGSFYALPQSPQIFKQLLMIAGMDRYFQIAQCFRDEDLRADRQPEFTQIDIEVSFESTEFLFELIERMMQQVFALKQIPIAIPFEKMTYAASMEMYGTDKPDLRFGMPLIRLNDIAAQFSFSIFLDVLKMGGEIKGFVIKNGAEISRKQIDIYTDFVKRYGSQGLVWVKWNAEDISSNVQKFASKEVFAQLKNVVQAEIGDLLFIVAGSSVVVNQTLDHLRRCCAKDRSLYSENDYRFVWITDFPLFCKEEGRWASAHHPFTAPLSEDIHLLETSLGDMRSSSYDLVLNGYEIGSGSERIYDSILQSKIFTALGISLEQAQDKFGFFIDALSYGTPPHLGIALGLDRLMMVLTQTDSIRDVIAFPKTQKAADLMTKAPSSVSEAQLKELSIITDTEIVK
ncbi:Aspartate--tRNA(Asp/Asn) ligase [Candidatus Clavichlamydia salmonicola]|uniref:aspartate--tRNA ligase n=1 Tax=Candidatus Clavichlamydia salmonicola TaxID=469812 RepID=UPI0018918B48|nr:aspartate--tRNA ligase [Candidatus Clavichlamydia salmonicola]MBF5050739.1 Aspartate--tRNA(Asp/Asn) ligase [Candidatus Clavichlamydia salmonicola]